MDADALDRLVQVDLAPVDSDLLRRPDLVGDVGRRHRAEEAPARAGAALEAQLDPVQLGRDLLGLLVRAGLVPGALLLALRVLGEERGRGRLREFARLEVVPHVAARDVHDVAAQADLLDV